MFYGRMQQQHERLLAQYGQGTVEVGRVETVPGDDEFTPPTTTTVYETVNGVVQGVSPEFADGSAILISDLQVQIGKPAGATPVPGDLVRLDGGAVHSIMAVEPIPAAGEPVGYDLRIRRG